VQRGGNTRQNRVPAQHAVRPWVSGGLCAAAGSWWACGGRQRALRSGTGEARRQAPPWRQRAACATDGGCPRPLASTRCSPRPGPFRPSHGTHRVRVGAEVLEGEGAEDEARKQRRRALALHALDNGGPRRGGGSPQWPPAAGQGRAGQGPVGHIPCLEGAVVEGGGGVRGPRTALSRAALAAGRVLSAAACLPRAASALISSAPAPIPPRSPGLLPPPARRRSLQNQTFRFALNGVICKSNLLFSFYPLGETMFRFSKAVESPCVSQVASGAKGCRCSSKCLFPRVRCPGLSDVWQSPACKLRDPA